MNRRSTFNICLTVVITAAFILLGAFVFGDSYLRFGETAKDFGLSVGYYFCTLFGLDHDIVPSVKLPKTSDCPSGTISARCSAWIMTSCRPSRSTPP